MPESFDAFRYISYLRSRWKFVALSCAVALTLAATVSLLMPREYTATARIVIEPPAGDPRSSTAVSPIYLESLKTYEHFADSDNLFQKAIDKFNLRAIFGSSPIESMKRRVLKVETVRNTRILEISATLPDPRKAQAVAQFLATSTADLSRSVANEGDRTFCATPSSRRERFARSSIEPKLCGRSCCQMSPWISCNRPSTRAAF